MADITTQKGTKNKDIMPLWYYDAFALRLMGFSEKDIAEKVGKSYDHVRTVFSKNGKIYKFWRTVAEERKIQETEDVMDMLWGRLSNSARRLVMHAEQGKGLVSLEAIRTHFSYTLGKPEDRVKLDATIGIFNFGDWALAQSESIKEKQNGIERSGEAIEGVSEESS